MAAVQPNTPKMRNWLKPGGLYGRGKFTGLVGNYNPSKFKMKAVKGSVGGAPKKRGTSGSSGQVKGYTDTRGRRVRAYVRGHSARGTTQSRAMVRKSGLVWGGKLFTSKSQFTRSLRAHGTSWEKFAKRHRQAAAGLTVRSTRTRYSR